MEKTVNALNNLLQAIKEENNSKFTTTRNAIEKGDINAINRYITDLRRRQLQNDTITLEKVEEIALKKLVREYEKKSDDMDELLSTINASNDFEEVTIVVTWTKSKTYGYCPTATLRDNKGIEITSGTIGGCGYDKLSTAIARVLNVYNPMLKLLYTLKNETIEVARVDGCVYFGYGLGYGILPYFQGGVGVGCFKRALEGIGLHFKEVSTENSNVITIWK